MFTPSAIRLQDKDFVGACVTLLSGQGRSASFAIFNDPLVTTGNFSATLTHPAPGMFSLHTSRPLGRGCLPARVRWRQIFCSVSYATRLLELALKASRL